MKRPCNTFGRVGGGSLAAFVCLAAAFSSARADTIYLKCGVMGPFVVDLTKQTVDGVPASITPISIDWDRNNQYGSQHLHVDRSTGTLRMSGHVSDTMPCNKISAPTTKF